MNHPPPAPARAISRRGKFAIGIFLVAAFKLWVVHHERICGSATEYDALWFLNAAKHWYWGSPYSWIAFARPPAYPLFVACVHLLRVPLRIGIELLQLGGYLALLAGLRKAGVSRAVCLSAFAVMVLHPGSFQLNNYTMADSFYGAVLALSLGGLFLTLFTMKLTHATWTGIALAVLWNTREESFLIPVMLIVFLGLAWIRQSSALGSWKLSVRSWLKPAGTMLGTLSLLVLAVDVANYRTFHSFSKSELTSSSFQGAYRALLRIKPSREQRFVSVSTEALEMAYKISPTFAQLKPQFQGELGRNWQFPAFTALGIHEIAAPWFLWALRSVTANTRDLHKTPKSANRFYRSTAKEINRACDEGRVPTRFVLSSFLDPGAIANISYMPESFPRIAGLFLIQYPKTTNSDDDILTDSQRALYDEMTGRSPADGGGGLSAGVENFIGVYYRVLVAALSMAALGATLILAWRFRRFQTTDSLNAVIILLAATIVLRVTLFTFLDATWWSGGYERYLFPVMPMYSCFLLVLVYQSIVLWRRPRVC